MEQLERIESIDLIELTHTLTAYVDAQFEYWLTISFAAIIAGAVAGERLGTKVRFFLVVLYLLTTALLLLQIFGTAQNIVSIVEVITARGLMPDGGSNLGPVQYFVRMLILFLGTVGTCWFLLVPRDILQKGST